MSVLNQAPTEAKSYESSPPLLMDLGQTMRFYITPSEPEDSPYRRHVDVTYDPTVEGSEPMNVPAHWHHDHDEIITAIEGSVRVTLGTGSSAQTTVLKPGMTPVIIHRNVIHAITSPPGERAVIRENNTFGQSRRKEQFFRHLLADGSAAGSAAPQGMKPMNFFRAMWEGDGGYPYLGGFGWKGLSVAFMYTMGPISMLFGADCPKLPDEDEYLQLKRST